MIYETFLVGRLGGDPEAKDIKNGKQLVTFTVASDDYNGDTDWVRCVCFDKQADLAIKHLKKGRLIGLRGRHKQREYTVTKDGVDFTQRSVELRVDKITFLDSNSERSGNGGNRSAAGNNNGGWGGSPGTWGATQQAQPTQQPAASNNPSPFASDDDFPF